MSVLASRVRKLTKRFLGEPDFHHYALADGIGVLLAAGSLGAMRAAHRPRLIEHSTLADRLHLKNRGMFCPQACCQASSRALLTPYFSQQGKALAGLYP